MLRREYERIISRARTGYAESIKSSLNSFVEPVPYRLRQSLLVVYAASAVIHGTGAEIFRKRKARSE